MTPIIKCSCAARSFHTSPKKSWLLTVQMSTCISAPIIWRMMKELIVLYKSVHQSCPFIYITVTLEMLARNNTNGFVILKWLVRRRTLPCSIYEVPALAKILCPVSISVHVDNDSMKPLRWIQHVQTTCHLQECQLCLASFWIIYPCQNLMFWLQFWYCFEFGTLNFASVFRTFGCVCPGMVTICSVCILQGLLQKFLSLSWHLSDWVNIEGSCVMLQMAPEEMRNNHQGIFISHWSIFIFLTNHSQQTSC